MQDFLTTRELAGLLRLKERKVYDLVATNAVPFTKVTGKLLFPRDQIEAWLQGSEPSHRGERPPVFLGSHDPLLEWALRQSDCGLASLLSGSGNGLSRFAMGEGVAAGLHLFDASTQDWNREAVKAAAGHLPAVLWRFAARERGLAVRADDSVMSLKDLEGRLFAARPADTGAQQLFEHLSENMNIRLTAAAASESDAAMMVAQGEADAAMGLPSTARQYGLRFVAILREKFDILIDRRSYFEKPCQRLLSFLGSEACRMQAGKLGGYDLGELGDVIWNGP